MSNYHSELKELIDRDKWLASEKAGYDLGEAFAREWLVKYERAFKKYYVIRNLKRCLENIANGHELNRIFLRETIEEIITLTERPEMIRQGENNG